MAKGNTVVVNFLGNDSGLKRTLGSVRRGLGGLGKLAVGAVGAVGVALGAVGVASIKAFADYEDKLNSSFAIMGGLSDDMKKKMGEAAREIGKTTRLSASEAAESFFFLSSAGLTAEQSLAALPQVAAFAQAGMFGMSLATDLATDAQSALGLTVPDSVENLENLTRVTDVLVKANTLANGSVEQFSAALTTKAGSTLKVFGKDMEEGVAVLAAFADQGIKGEVAGTQLGIVLRDLSTKAIQNKSAFRSAGVSVFDAAGEMRNIADIVGDLEGAMGGLSDEAAKKMLLDLGFSDRSLAALQQIIGSSDKIRGFEEELRNAGGATQEVADNQLKSFNGQMSLLKGQLEDVAITIGSKLAPLLLKGFQLIADWWKKNGVAIKKAVTDAFNSIIEWWEKNEDTIREGVQLYIDWVKFVFPLIIDVITDTFDTVVGWWDDNGESVITKAQETFEKVVATATPIVERLVALWPGIVEAVENVIASLKAIWELWGDEFVAEIEIIIDAVVPIIEGIVTVVEGMIEVVTGILTGDWSAIWEGAKKVVTGAFTVIGAAVFAAISTIGVVLSAVGSLVSTLFSKPWTTAKNKVRGAINTTVTIVRQVGARVKAGLSGFKTKVVAVFTGAWDAVVEKAEGVGGRIKTALLSIPGKIREMVSSVKAAGRAVGSGIMTGMRDGISGAIAFVGTIATGVKDALVSTINVNVIDKINRSLEFPIPIPFFDDLWINPPDIPHLASGGVTGVNNPFLAVVGDNRTEKEIITPEGLMYDVVKSALGESGSRSPSVIIENINMDTHASPEDISDAIMWSLRGAA